MTMTAVRTTDILLPASRWVSSSPPVVRTTTTRKDGEYIVRAYGPKGQRIPDADYYTDDKGDAQQTAALMVAPHNVFRTVETAVATNNQDCVSIAVALANELIQANDGQRLITIDAAILAAAIIEGIKANRVSHDEFVPNRSPVHAVICESSMSADKWKDRY